MLKKVIIKGKRESNKKIGMISKKNYLSVTCLSQKTIYSYRTVSLCGFVYWIPHFMFWRKLWSGGMGDNGSPPRMCSGDEQEQIINNIASKLFSTNKYVYICAVFCLNSDIMTQWGAYRRI